MAEDSKNHVLIQIDNDVKSDGRIIADFNNYLILFMRSKMITSYAITYSSGLPVITNDKDGNYKDWRLERKKV